MVWISIVGSSLFNSKVASRSTCTRYQRWRSVFSGVYFMKNNFDCETTVSACLHPLFSWGMTSIGGLLVISVSKFLNISVTEESVGVAWDRRTRSSSWQLTTSFDADCGVDCFLKYASLYISILSASFQWGYYRCIGVIQIPHIYCVKGITWKYRWW